LTAFATLHGALVQMLGANSEDLKTAAAFALGAWGCGCDGTCAWY
jgi:hypothetical protein